MKPREASRKQEFLGDIRSHTDAIKLLTGRDEESWYEMLTEFGNKWLTDKMTGQGKAGGHDDEDVNSKDQPED